LGILFEAIFTQLWGDLKSLPIKSVKLQLYIIFIIKCYYSLSKDLDKEKTITSISLIMVLFDVASVNWLVIENALKSNNQLL